MKRGAVYSGVVERVDFPNKGRIFVEENGEVTGVTVKNVIPGQMVEFAIKKAKKGRCEGRLLQVIKPSPLETQQRACRNFGACGGCSYQTVPYEEQVKLKAGQVKRLLSQVCPEIETVFEGISCSPSVWEYRNKMEFSFGDEYKDGPLALGLHKRGSMYDVLTADDCRLVHPDYNKVLSCTLAHFSERGTPYYHKNHEGVLRHLLVRRAVYTGELLVSLITSGQYKGYEMDLEQWKEALLALPLDGKVTGILHIVNDSLADVVKCDEMKILYGKDFFYDEVLGLRFKISTFSFFQTNTRGAEVLYRQVREYIGDTKDKTVFDLYSGTGTIAQLMAPVAKKVIGVEIVEEAVEAAKENAKENGLKNCEFIAGDVLKVLDEIEEVPDLIILDPPRDGIHPKALKRIAAYIGAEKIVYISCKPTSLARDLIELQKYGYRVGRVCCVDMFPGTCHVETVVLIQRKDT